VNLVKKPIKGLVTAPNGFYHAGVPGVLGQPGHEAYVEGCELREAVWTQEAVWRERGACKGLDPQIFYPETDEDADAAKRVCSQCHVQTACLEYALQSREREGVWGATTERERRRIIRQRRRSA
jgi:WhiB family transcriptional regulator, redox-sensing transcriptional regulator